jgi:hypothetical protein
MLIGARKPPHHDMAVVLQEGKRSILSVVYHRQNPLGLRRDHAPIENGTAVAKPLTSYFTDWCNLKSNIRDIRIFLRPVNFIPVQLMFKWLGIRTTTRCKPYVVI